MARKFKLIFLSTLLLILILGTTSLGATVEDLNTSLDNRWLGKESMRNLLTELNFTFTETELTAYATQFNLWFQTVEDETITLKNIIFWKRPGENLLYWIMGNGTFSNTLPYTYFAAYNMNKEGTDNFYNFVSWQKNSAGAITGANTTGITVYMCDTSMFNMTNNSVAVKWYTGNISLEEIYINEVVTALPTFTIYGYTPNYGYKTYFLSHTYDLELTEPVEPTPSGETSGDTGGGTGGSTNYPDYSEDLNNIQNGITDINNNIGETNNKLDNLSGELSNINNNLTTVPDISDTTITNDDIINNLDFEFEQDPYTNFWFNLTTGLSNAFTNSKREISIQFRDKTHIISLDNFSVQVPSALKPFLTIISTVFITWKMLQYIKIIIDNISSGNIDKVLEMNEEEGITNLF